MIGKIKVIDAHYGYGKTTGIINEINSNPNQNI